MKVNRAQTMVRLASVLVYVELHWLEKGPAVPGLPAQVTLRVPRGFPRQRNSFCAGSPGSLYLPANLCRVSSARTAGSQSQSSQSFLLATGLCASFHNGLQVTGNKACHPSPSQASRLPSSRLREDVHSSNRSGSGISSSFV